MVRFFLAHPVYCMFVVFPYGGSETIVTVIDHSLFCILVYHKCCGVFLAVPVLLKVNIQDSDCFIRSCINAFVTICISPGCLLVLLLQPVHLCPVTTVMPVTCSVTVDVINIFTNSSLVYSIICMPLSACLSWHSGAEVAGETRSADDNGC